MQSGVKGGRHRLEEASSRRSIRSVCIDEAQAFGRMSTPRTVCPEAIRASAKFVPIWPDDPVTTILTAEHATNGGLVMADNQRAPTWERSSRRTPTRVWHDQAV